MTQMLRDIADRASLEREIRSHDITDMEIRTGSDGAITFDGIASVVDKPYAVRDMFGDYQETIAKGAFNRTIKQKADVRLLKNHDPNFVFARTKSGTLQLSAEPDLRAFAPSLDPANPQVQTLRSEMDRGDINQMSIGMRVKDQVWSSDYTERMIKEVELFDVSAVTYPASPTTSASLRSLDEWLESLRDIEMTDDEVRRAIEHFTKLLPAAAEEIAVDLSAQREADAALRAMREEANRRFALIR